MANKIEKTTEIWRLLGLASTVLMRLNMIRTFVTLVLYYYLWKLWGKEKERERYNSLDSPAHSMNKFVCSSVHFTSLQLWIIQFVLIRLGSILKLTDWHKLTPNETNTSNLKARIKTMSDLTWVVNIIYMYLCCIYYLCNCLEQLLQLWRMETDEMDA